MATKLSHERIELKIRNLRREIHRLRLLSKAARIAEQQKQDAQAVGREVRR